jgi:hypothetical protein
MTKSEGRNPKEARNPNTESCIKCCVRAFVIRISNFFRISDLTPWFV